MRGLRQSDWRNASCLLAGDSLTWRISGEGGREGGREGGEREGEGGREGGREREGERERLLQTATRRASCRFPPPPAP